MVRIRQLFFFMVFATMFAWHSISAQESANENTTADSTAVKPNPNRQILGSWRGGPEGIEGAEATFTFVFNGALFINNDEKAQWKISGEAEPLTLTISYKDSIYEDEEWGLTFESDSTLMFYLGETVEILMKKVE
jgi:hypothetical protein